MPQQQLTNKHGKHKWKTNMGTQNSKTHVTSHTLLLTAADPLFNCSTLLYNAPGTPSIHKTQCEPKPFSSECEIRRKASRTSVPPTLCQQHLSIGAAVGQRHATEHGARVVVVEVRVPPALGGNCGNAVTGATAVQNAQTQATWQTLILCVFAF